jgi:hypothetical protein
MARHRERFAIYAVIVVAEKAQLNWSKWIRQTHRWLSIVFTVAVIINGVTVVQGRYNNRLGLSAVAILAFLHRPVLVRAAVCQQVAGIGRPRMKAMSNVIWFDRHQQRKFRTLLDCIVEGKT